jgi:hypothetical protein
MALGPWQSWHTFTVDSFRLDSTYTFYFPVPRLFLVSMRDICLIGLMPYACLKSHVGLSSTLCHDRGGRHVFLIYCVDDQVNHINCGDHSRNFGNLQQI